MEEGGGCSRQADRQTDRDREVLCKQSEVSPFRGIFDASLF